MAVDTALSATHSVLGIEIRLAGNEVLSALVVTGPHRHMQRRAEQLKKNQKTMEGVSTDTVRDAKAGANWVCG